MTGTLFGTLTERRSVARRNASQTRPDQTRVLVTAVCGVCGSGFHPSHGDLGGALGNYEWPLRGEIRRWAMSLYVYRIEVTRWPTDDDQPWARFYGPNAATPNHEVPDWLAVLVEAAMPLLYVYRDTSPQGRVAARIRYDDDRDELVGVLMPKPKRRNYLSASGASELAADMRAFGAEVTVRRSEPVRWS